MTRVLAAVASAAMLATTVTATAGAVASTGGHLPAPPKSPHESAAIEGFAPDQAQFFCRHSVQPGVRAFEKLALSTYPVSHSDGDLRACDDGGTSEHKDGRAFDWGVDHRIPAQRRAGESMLKWLFATDKYGNRDAMFRRLGLMYIIWNKRIWGAWDQRWEPYACSGVTLCHVDHMHFSFGWAGAEKRTSYWTHHVSGVREPDLPVLGRVGSHRTITVRAAQGSANALWLLKGGATYPVLATGVWHDGKTASDAVCQKSGHSWRPAAGGALRVSGDLFQLWNAQWVPTHDSGHGCNTTTHAYRLTINPGVLSTISASLPNASSRASGTVRVRFARAG